MTVPKMLAQVTVTSALNFGFQRAAEAVTDGNMESATTAAWTASRSTPLPTLTKETGTPHGGTRCLRIATGAGDNGTALQDCGLGTGARRITGWARGDGVAAPNVYQTGYGYVWNGTNSTDWQSFDETWTSAGDTIELLNNSANRYVEFDDVSIQVVTATTASVGATSYGSILEVCSALQTSLQAIQSSFGVAVSESGIVTISCAADWDVLFSTTSDTLETMLGFAGSEAVATSAGHYILTATSQHRYGFYPDVGVRYPIDRRRKALRSQDTADGNVANYTDDTVHRYRELSFSLLSLEETSEGGSDGSKTWTNVTLRDFWEYAIDRPFRFYASASTGTVAAPGTRGTDFDLLRFHEMDTFAPQNVADADSWAYWDITLPCKVVAS